MQYKALCLVLCLGVLPLAGCMKTAPKEKSIDAAAFMDTKLRDAADAISRDMAQLSGSAQNRDFASEKGSGSLYSKMDLIWDGPIEGALRKVASTIGFRFEVSGEAPLTPVTVHVRLTDRPAIAVLREIGMRTGPNEGVVINESAKTIALKYTPRKS